MNVLDYGELTATERAGLSRREAALVAQRLAHLNLERLTLQRRLDSLCPAPLRTMTQIAEEVAGLHALSLGDLKSDRRNRAVAWPRQHVMFELAAARLASGRRRWSLPQIGLFLGGRDHTTVLYGIRAHARRNGLTIDLTGAPY